MPLPKLMWLKVYLSLNKAETDPLPSCLVSPHQKALSPHPGTSLKGCIGIGTVRLKDWKHLFLLTSLNLNFPKWSDYKD